LFEFLTDQKINKLYGSDEIEIVEAWALDGVAWRTSNLLILLLSLFVFAALSLGFELSTRKHCLQILELRMGTVT